MKNGMCYYFCDIIKIEYFDLHNVLRDDILYKSLIDSRPLCIRFNKRDGFIKVGDGTRYEVLFGSKNVIPFTTGLDIL